VLTVLDMNRPRFQPGDINMYSCRPPRQDDCPGFVSYPTMYYGRPPRPTGCGTSVVRPVTAQYPASDFKTKDPDFIGTFPKDSVQHTFDSTAKKSASEKSVDVNAPSTGSSSTAEEMEQLKWRVGQGPMVDLRLLVPGRVG